MSRPELDQIKQRYADVIAQLDTLEAAGDTISQDQSCTKEDLLEELGKIEHWLWALEPD